MRRMYDSLSGNMRSTYRLHWSREKLPARLCVYTFTRWLQMR